LLREAKAIAGLGAVRQIEVVVRVSVQIGSVLIWAAWSFFDSQSRRTAGNSLGNPTQKILVAVMRIVFEGRACASTQKLDSLAFFVAAVVAR
jgi:hypothetical protein